MRFLYSLKVGRMGMLACLLLCTGLAFSQNSPDSKQSSDFFHHRSVVMRFHYGYLWAHKPKIDNLVTGHTTGFQLDFEKQTDGNKWWQADHGYPQTGLSFIYLNLANEKLVGNASAVTTYINFPFVKSRSFLFSLKFGAGLGYLTKRYEREENHQNLAIGSHLNAAIQVLAETRYRLSKKMYANLNYGITHFSNGAFHIPNLGINNISLNGGLTYQFSKPDTLYKPAIPELNRHWYFDVFYGFGVKESYPPNEVQYFAHTLCFSFLKPVSHKTSLGLGGDVFYDLSLQRNIYDATSHSDLVLKTFKAGLHGSYEMVINKVNLYFQVGAYVYDQVKLDGTVYHRLGFKYELGEHLFTNLSLKTHYFRADYAELGLGWRIRNTKSK